MRWPATREEGPWKLPTHIDVFKTQPVHHKLHGVRGSSQQSPLGTAYPSSQTHNGAQMVSAFRPRGVPGPMSKLSPRVPAQMGRRKTEHEGGKEEGREAKEETYGLRVVLRPGRVRLQYGVTSVRVGESEKPYASSRSPARPTSCMRALDLPFIGVRRGSRCTTGSVAVC
jgi:hypothetical protein